MSGAFRYAHGRLFADALPDGFGRRQFDARGAENVQTQPHGDVYERLLCLDRVARTVQGRRERRQAHYAGDDGHNAAADARFGRKPRVEEPVARMLVEADGAL